MSFKRDGDDKCSLDSLRKRRVNDLFSEDIPEKEAKLLSNGKLTCTVCGNRPIFDTVSMLAIHRKGKKHLYYEELELQKKEELKELIRKRKHEQYLQDGTTNIKMADESNGGYKTSQPYDSRSKRKKLKPHERKPRIDLSQSDLNTTDIHSLPGNQKDTLESLQAELNSPILHTNRLKHFSSKNTDPETFKPYISSKRVGSHFNKVFNTEPVKSYSTAHSSNFGSYLTPYGQLNSENYCRTYDSVPLDLLKMPPPPPPPPPSSPKDTLSDTNIKNKLSEEEEMKARKYLQLRGAGWKKDWDGKWIKDEDAEFDSDEEPPDL